VNRKRLFNLLRIVISAALVVFVCYNIRLSDTLVLKDGTEIVGRLVEKGPDGFAIETPDGKTRAFTREDLQHDADGRLTGVHRGIVTVFREIDPAWFVPTFLFVGLIPVVGALRLHLLLRVQGVTLTVGRAVGLTFLGYFFNNFMLGLTGGDVVKAFYVARRTHKRTEAVVTVFVDRVVGLIALALLAAAMVTVNLGDVKFRRTAGYVWIFLAMACFMILVLYSRRLRRRVEYTLLGVAAVGGGLIVAWRIWMQGWDAVWVEVVLFVAVLGVFAPFILVGPLRRLLRLSEMRQWLGRRKLVREMDETFHVFSGRPGPTVIAFVMSFFCHWVTATGVWGFARALGITADYHYFLVLVPVIMMITAIPVSVAGWGVQEAVFQMFFGMVGVAATEAITLSFVYRLCAAVLWSLPGGVVLMLSRDRAGLDEMTRAMSEEQGAS